jgi:hypothetical protein
LKVNGVNFFDFNSIFQLGTPAMIVRPAPSTSHRVGSEADPYLSIEERQAIARAKLESMRDLNSNHSRSQDSNDRQKLAPLVTQEHSLIKFEENPPPQQVNYSTNSVGQTTSKMSIDFRSTSFESQTSPMAANSNMYTNYTLPPAAPVYPNYSQQPSTTTYNTQNYTSTNPPPPTSYAYLQPPVGTHTFHNPVGQPAPTPATANANATINPYSQAFVPNSSHTQETPISMQTHFQPFTYPQGNSNLPLSNSSTGQSSSIPTSWGPTNNHLSIGSSNNHSASVDTHSIPAPWGPPNPSYYSHQPASIAPSNDVTFASLTSPQSQVSYGSAPSFAQPPRQQSSEQFGGY